MHSQLKVSSCLWVWVPHERHCEGSSCCYWCCQRFLGISWHNSKCLLTSKTLVQISKIPLAQCTQHKKEKSNGAKYYDFSGFYNKKCKMLNSNERTHIDRKEHIFNLLILIIIISYDSFMIFVNDIFKSFPFADYNSPRTGLQTHCVQIIWLSNVNKMVEYVGH